MNINMDGNFLRTFRGGGLNLKSTQDRLERQQQTQKQVDFFEAQKNNLKDMLCQTPEEIKEKLEMLHSYDDQIAAAKAAYNQEQLFHILDEAKEMGEKIAEAAEKFAPKTPEELREELVEEVTGADKEEGLLDEILDEVEQLVEDREAMNPILEETLPDEDALEGEMKPGKPAQETLTEELIEKNTQKKLLKTPENMEYKPFDRKI